MWRTADRWARNNMSLYGMEITELRNALPLSLYVSMSEADNEQPQVLSSVWLSANLQTFRVITADKAGRSRVVTIIKMSHGTGKRVPNLTSGREERRNFFVCKYLLCCKSALWLDIKSQEFRCHAAALTQWLEIERTNRCLNKVWRS